MMSRIREGRLGKSWRGLEKTICAVGGERWVLANPNLRPVMAQMSSRTLSYLYKALMVCVGLSYQRRLPSSIDFLMSSIVIHLVS